jgi:hypothetical protein
MGMRSDSAGSPASGAVTGCRASRRGAARSMYVEPLILQAVTCALLSH